jgi:hypothetical protein
MVPSLWQRIQALLAQPDRPLSDLRLVMFANGWTALAISIAGAVALGGPFGWAAALAPVVFAFLTGCLLFRGAFWVPACLVALVHGALAALVVGYLAIDLPPAVHWVGGALGFVVGFGAVFKMYATVASASRRTGTSPQPSSVLRTARSKSVFGRSPK